MARQKAAFYLMVVIASFAMWLAVWLLFGQRTIAFLFGWASPFMWVGWLGAALIALGRFWGRHDDQVPCLELLLPLFMMISGAWQAWMLHQYQPYPSADEFLLAFERNYGDLAVKVAQWLHGATRILPFFKNVYLCSILPLVIVYLSLPPVARIRRRLWLSFALMGMSGVLLYQVCPAAGPVYSIASYPMHVARLDPPQLKLLPHAIYNAIPSLHLALALLTLLYARYCRGWVYIGAILFTALTAVATLGLGEHYTIDLIVAVPFLIGVEAVTEALHATSARWVACACVSMVLAWEVALRRGAALELPAPIVWGLSIATVLIPLLLRGAVTSAPEYLVCTRRGAAETVSAAEGS